MLKNKKPFSERAFEAFQLLFSALLPVRGGLQYPGIIPF